MEEQGGQERALDLQRVPAPGSLAGAPRAPRRETLPWESRAGGTRRGPAGWPGRRVEAEEFSVERGFVSSRFQSNSSQSSQNSPSEERKVREVQAGYSDSREAEHHFAECRPSPRVGRDGNLAEGRSCLVKGDSRDTGEGASLFPVRRRGAKGAVGWGGRAVALSILLGEMGCLPRELRRRRLGHVLPQESLRLGLRACTLGRNLKMSWPDHFVLQRRKRRFGA
ncbi:uncharacterized protein LOC123788714 [Ursus americanus]|uniref:uncharacterized protein LOC123788714 n=1 Tax=Ursus americanus TaxID=9643 RepID=UPI001E679C27|nr:uncharacterized protein LOC123788714 [Ursus americanus]